MPYKYLGQLTTVTNNGNGVFDCQIPGYNKKTDSRSIYVSDYLGYRLPNQIHRVYWIYVYDHENDKEFAFKGEINTIYDGWFFLRRHRMNPIQMYDFLYAFDHREQLELGNVGILYELVPE